MTSGAGFTSRLLAKARGEITELRPRIRPYFEGATDEGDIAPRVEERAVKPVVETRPPSVSQGPETPVETAPIAEQPRAQTVEAPPPLDRAHAPLMPREPERERAPERPPPHDEMRERRDVAAPEAKPPPDTPRGQTAEPTHAAASVVQEKARTLQASTPPPKPPSIEGELARALARLDAGSEHDAPPRLMPQQPPPDSVAPSRPAPPPLHEPAPSREAGSEAPLTIHIGQVVVAPDPAPTPPPARRERTSWTPALSLDDYRAQRSRSQT